MSNLTVAARITVTGNKDTGSLPVQAKDLPKAFQENGLRPAPGSLAVREVGSKEIKPVTYIMGSQAKGYHLCCKGSGKFPTEGSSDFEILVPEQATEEMAAAQ